MRSDGCSDALKCGYEPDDGVVEDNEEEDEETDCGEGRIREVEGE